jgi:hypothetical protein
MTATTRWIRLPVLVVLLASACMPGDGTPVGPSTQPLPPPPPQASTFGYVWGHVVMDSGVCISGAVVTVLEGPGMGRSMRQEGPCDAWSYAVGFEFADLPLGARVKLGATADGYDSQELEIVVGNGGPPVQFELHPD